MTDLLVKILLVVIFLAGGYFILDRMGDYKDRAEAAEGALAAYAKNDTLNGKLVDAFNERQAKLKPITNTIIKEIHRDRPPVDVSCNPTLDPLWDAANGVRRLQAASKTR